MESQLIVKTPSSILSPVTAKNSSFPNLFGISKNYKSWNGEEKKWAVSLRLQRPQQLFTTAVNNSNILKNRVRANAVSEYNFHQSELIVVPNSLQWESFRRNLDVFCRFARLNTVFARALSVTSVCLLTVEKISDISPIFLTGMLLVIVAAVSMNTYLVGLNHLCDIEIDKVNKPEYPLASGEYSVKTGVFIVLSAAILGLSIPVFLGSQPLFWGLFVGFFLLGFAYSVDLPLLRWKRSPLLTAICLIVCNSVIQMGYYLHMKTHLLGRAAVFSKSLLFTVAITDFFIVIFGGFKVFKICVSLMQIAYLTAMLVGATFSNTWSRYLTVIGHAVMALILQNRVRSFDYSGPAVVRILLQVHVEGEWATRHSTSCNMDFVGSQKSCNIYTLYNFFGD